MRLALFSPLPPNRSGIAAYAAELLPLLSRMHRVEVFTDQRDRGAGLCRPADPQGPSPASAGQAGGEVAIRSAHDFVWRHATNPFDLVVYQLGNDRCHDYMWPYLLQYPGLTVLHDGQLHQARALSLLRRQRYDQYRREFAWSHPRADPRIAELVIARLGARLFYLYPMRRAVLESARMIAVHSPWLADRLREESRAATVATIRMGVADPRLAECRVGAEVRARLGIDRDTTLFVATGRVTPEKRISQVLRALRWLVSLDPRVRLALVGDAADYYDVMKEARDLGVADFVTLAGYVEDRELPAWLLAADVCLCLRWPTSREMSASWLRAVAAGRATVVSDLAHLGHVPMLDSRSRQLLRASAADSPDAGRPIAVAIDVEDEVHCLRLAMQQLAGDRDLRERLGRAAREWWSREATLELMAADYDRVLLEAASLPIPPRPIDWPSHLAPDPAAYAKTLAREMQVEVDILDAGEAP